MEASCISCGGVSASIFGLRRQSISLYQISNRRVSSSSPSPVPAPTKRRRSRKVIRQQNGLRDNGVVPVETRSSNKQQQVESRSLPKNGDPLGRRDLGKAVVKWISQGMKAMALDFAMAEIEMEEESEFAELIQRIGPGLTFVIQAQPYLNAVPMPVGMEVICLKACTHYPTLFDHFQRELRDLLQQLQNKSLIPDWRQTQSWLLLKDLANSGLYISLLHLFGFSLLNLLI